VKNNLQEQVDRIRERLHEVGGRLSGVESALQELKANPTKLARAWSHIWRWVTTNKTVSGLGGLVLLVAGWFVTGYYQHWLDHKHDAFNLAVDERVKASTTVTEMQKTLAEIQKTSSETNTVLTTLQPYIHDMVIHQFENISKLPARSLIQRAPALKDLLAVAKNQRVSIDPKVIEQVGVKLAHCSASAHPATWDAALEFINYKSFNNNYSPFLPDTTNEKDFRDKYVIYIPTGGVAPVSTLRGLAPADSAAQTGYIGEDRNKGMASGLAWIILEGG
jgi:hypothetical protein